MKIYKTHKVKMPTTAVTSNSTEMNPIGRCGIDCFYFGSVFFQKSRFQFEMSLVRLHSNDIIVTRRGKFEDEIN